MNEQPKTWYYASDYQFVTLPRRIADLVDEDADERFNPIWKVQVLPLIYEAHQLAGRLSRDFSERKHYFDEAPLQDYLTCVREIEQVQQKMVMELRLLLYIEKKGDVQPEPNEGEVEIQLFTPEDRSVSPLWDKSPQTMGQAFYNAHEEWSKWEDLDSYFIKNPASGLLDEAKPPQTPLYLTQMCQAVSGLADRQIYQELMQALELLRVLFMQQADIIYGIRTGDRTMIPDVKPFDIDKETILDSPFFDYHVERARRRIELKHDLEHRSLDDWRLRQGIVGRPLSHAERIHFLTERREEVLRQMQEQHPQLWALRAHCGGCDAEVNAENFARTFYGRGGTDRTFFHLQWELEYLDELLMTPRSASVELSPAEQAMSDFVEKMTRLVSTCHERWHGQRCKPGAHQPEVTVEIRKDDLIQCLNQQLADNAKPLWEYCNPATSQSKQLFCNYVVRLIKEGYFGQLPKKELARILAPIVGLSEGTVSNYLSQD